MAALDFPASPTAGQIYSAPNGIVYVWDATKGLWLVQQGVVTGAVGDFSATHNANFTLAAVGGPLALNTVLGGNLGGYYNTSNGRFTPPAGRYKLSAGLTATHTSSATAILLNFRKNGTAITQPQGIDTATANNWCSTSIDIILDLNGTDYVDVFASATLNTTNTQAYFNANPITGVTPSPGDTMLRLYSEQVAVGGETQLNVLVPINARRVELDFASSAAAGDPNAFLQTVVSGTPNALNNHIVQKIFATGVTAPAAAQVTSTSWDIGGTGHSRGTIQLKPWAGSNIWSGTIALQMSNAAGTTRYYQAYAIDGGANPNVTTGFRVTLGASSFVAGSYLRSFVVP